MTNDYAKQASMRDGWESVRLGELFSPVRTLIGVRTHEPPVFSVSKHEGVVFSDAYFERRVASQRLDRYKELAPKDWVYSTIHIDEGSIARNNLDIAGAVSPMYTVMRWSSQNHEPRYAELLLRSIEMLARYADSSQGSINRRRSLPWKAFSQLEVSLPPIAEQRRIVDLIGAVDETIEAAEAEHLRCRALAKNSRLLYFSQGDGVPLGQACDVSVGKQLQSSNSEGRSIPYLRAGNISDGSLDLVVMKEMFMTEAEVERFSLEIGDVMVVEGGNGFGKSGVWTGAIQGPVAYQNHVLRLRPTNPEYSTNYLAQWALWAHEQDKFKPSGTGIPNIGVGRARQMLIRSNPFQSMSEELQLAEISDSSAKEARAHADALRDLRANLLTVLLSGQHEIPKSYDRFLEGEAA